MFSMGFVGVEFLEGDDGGIALVHKKWLTPRKKEVWWPPFKQQDHFLKSLKKGESPCENWKLYGVARLFFEEEDFVKASKKLKQAECISDIQSEPEYLPPKRRIKRRALFDDSTSDEEEERRSPVRQPKVLGLEELLKKRENLLSDQKEQLSKQQSQKSCLGEFELQDLPQENHSNPVTHDSRPITTQSWSENSTGANELGKTLLSYLVTIKNQNTEILARLKEKENISTSEGIALPNNLPVELPLQSTRDVRILEEYLNDDRKISSLAAHFANFGGRDLTNRVNIILKSLFTNKVAVNYNFCGSRGEKRPFGKLKLKAVIVEAVLLKSPAISVHQIENQIKIWLKHAPKRVHAEEQKRK